MKLQYNLSMIKILLIIFIVSFIQNGHSQSLTEIESHRISLPNGWKLTPVGDRLLLGDLPLNIAVSHSGKFLAVTNNGESDQTVELINVKKQEVEDTIIMKKAWLGLAFSEDDKSLFASGGNDNWIVRFAITNHRLVPKDTIILGKPWPVKLSVAGIAVDSKKQVLYAVTKDNNSLYVADLKTRTVSKRLELGAEAYTCLLSPDGKILYISCWGCKKIEVFDTEKQKLLKPIEVGSNPNDICMSKDGHLLFVANANDNSVSVIDLEKQKVIETLNTALYPNSPAGSTANSVALSKDNKTLYVANADNNCLAVFDISQPGASKSKGFIPTGWYPTCVRVIGNKIYVSNGKGFSSMANPQGPNPFYDSISYQLGVINNKRPALQFIARLFRGQLSIINVPDDQQLAIYSQAVYNNTPYRKEKENNTEGRAGNPIPFKLGDPSPIKYVFYVIKENRTYDQILGDMPEGNGDTALVLFGKKITPNQHALAHEFVLLDNFYVDGEVSADGHSWTMGAYATDFLEKTWPTSYGRRGGSYDAEGFRSIANNKNGFIWDYCKRAGVTYRTYGEFATNYKPNIPVLQDHYCHYFTGWDQKIRDTARFSQWKQDFDSLLSVGGLPRLNTLRFINDHTEGLKRGRPTPFAAVADNDLAVGLFVDYLSHSPIWKESAIFIVEDDAQDGPDHVDAHRSAAYVAGGFVKQGFVDHTMYSTSSVLRTIEMILDIPPMSQYDAAANPLWRCFTDLPNHPSFQSKLCLVDLNQKNNVVNKWSLKSDLFDFSLEDMAPEAELNEVIWVAVKGEQSICPPPKHSAFFRSTKDEDDD
jgi:YVTN family beta-propeller protein